VEGETENHDEEVGCGARSLLPLTRATRAGDLPELEKSAYAEGCEDADASASFP
jgi:hypothetical protein